MTDATVDRAFSDRAIREGVPTPVPSEGPLTRWADGRPRAAVGLIIAAAVVMAVFGWGGLFWLRRGGTGLMGVDLSQPALWQVVIVAGGFVAASVAFAVWRRTQPVAFFFAAMGFQALWTVALLEPDVIVGSWVFLWLAYYYVTQRVTTLAAWLCLFTSLAVHTLLLAALRPAAWEDAWQYVLLMTVGLNIGAGAVAILRGTRRRYVEALLERNRVLAAQRDQRAELAVAAERNRIAREMHDIVSHSLAVMVTLSDGAARLIGQAPDEAAAAMAEVSKTGRHAVSDMRRLIGFLRSEADLKPQPSISDLGDLIASCQQSGLPIRVELSTTLPDDPAFGLTVYRIVQEALANVLRHASASPDVAIRIAQSEPGVYDIVVENAPGASPIIGAGPGSGQGLLGMRQRVEVWNGSLDAAATAKGGWRVHAVLEYEPE
ncbi:MAG: histidine kinase [Propionibacteriaceae bacterium]|nr:histidine kinase [Propionibacteriaceae bacterium]